MNTENICLSGGARGSDLEWGKHAKAAGHKLIHYSFVGHRAEARENLHRLTPKQLLEADPYLVKAAPKLNKYYRSGRNPNDYDSSTPNLLRRNWWQVKDAERVYAISTIKDGIVQGGTAWAVQMFLDRHTLKNGEAAECYVYDQETKTWNIWSTPMGWVTLHSRLPRPYGRYAGIGTRDINSHGLKAISEIYK